MKDLAFVSDSVFLSWSPSSLFVPLTAEAKWLPLSFPMLRGALALSHLSMKLKRPQKQQEPKRLFPLVQTREGYPKDWSIPHFRLCSGGLSPKGQVVQPAYFPGFVLKAVPPISDIFMLLILPNSGLSIMHGKEDDFMANKADWKTDFFLTSAYLWTQPMRL